MWSRLKAPDQNPASLCPPEIFARQVLVPVRFRTFEGGEGSGEIAIDEALTEDVAKLFAAMLDADFPVTSAIPVSVPRFSWDDVRSMTANNCSGFNYRTIAGTERLSYHALGKAIDINPALNPYFHHGIVEPPGAEYLVSRPGTIAADSFLVRLMDELGWEWGGRWKNPDYQHFQKA